MPPSRTPWILAVLALLPACDASDGGVTGAQPEPVASAVVISPESVEFTELGETVQLEARVLDQNGQPISGASPIWFSADSSLVEVDAQGRVTALGYGPATIRAQFSSLVDSVPSLLPLSGTLLLSRGPDGLDQLFTLDGGDWTFEQLTDGAESGGGGRWSPDGTRIAFTRRGETADVWLMDADGSGATGLLVTPESEAVQDWSPDGTRLVLMAARGSRFPILTVDVADGSERRISDGGNFPDWSPDGSRIAYASSRSAGGEVFGQVWTMAPDGSDARLLVELPDVVVHPAWSPDGTRIAFASDVSGNADYGIFVVGADGSNLTRLSPGGGFTPNDYSPVWSPDGSRILFSAAGKLMVMEADGTGRAPLGDLRGTDADWKP